MTWLTAVFFRQFVALIVVGLICLPIRLLVQRYMADGPLKRFLLRPAYGRRSKKEWARSNASGLQ